MNLDWMDRIACKDQDPELFFPTATGKGATREAGAAALICAACPVQRECGEHRKRTGAASGVWGNTYHNTKGRRTLAPINHGTDAGYHQHLKRGLPICHSCRQAHKYANRKWEQRCETQG